MPTFLRVYFALVSAIGPILALAAPLEGRADEIDNVRREIGSLLGEAEASEAAGDWREAERRLRRALVLAEGSSSDPRALAAVAGALGNVLVATGPEGEAEALLRRARDLALRAEAEDLAGSIENNLGNLFSRRGDSPAALHSYREAARLAAAANDPNLLVRALANAARASLAGGDLTGARALVTEAVATAGSLEPRTQVTALVHAARTLQLGASVHGASALTVDLAASDRLRAHALLAQAAELASRSGDALGLSWSLGTMAELYESEGRNGEALDLARRAIAQAERGGGPDVVARWSAQAGRLLVATGDLEGAITAWSRAVAARRGSRSATSVSYTGDAASSATTDWPMYLGLVDALLRRSATADGDAAQALLARARDTLELLKADELRDYFRDECVDAQRARLTRVAEASASALVVYPIALPDRLEILVQGRSRGLEHRSVPVGAKALRAEIRSLRRLLERRTTREYLRPAQRLYDWLVRPLAPDLASDEVDTLVFVPDAALRTIPVASLHDGERFLVERFALAITPGLELTDPRPLDRGDLRPLVAGLSEPGGGLAPLPHIDAEVRAVHASIGGTLLVGDAFRREALHASLAGRAFNVVHIATHGEVLADARQSFLVASDGRIGMDELAADVGLARFRETPLELLTLSACETAEGDERAALGLSGIAVQAGARSVLGTLWNVNDAASAALMGELYRALLTPGTSRAAALQRAQQKLIADPRWRHPAYWSGFLLIGSWL